MNLVKKFFLIGIAVLCLAMVRAEYVFYEIGDDGSSAGPLTNTKKWGEVFALINKYQFPMNIAANLSFEEIGKLRKKGEENFIRECLPVGVGMFYVPTSLYQLFFIMCYLQAAKKSWNSAIKDNIQDIGNTRPELKELLKQKEAKFLWEKRLFTIGVTIDLLRTSKLCRMLAGDIADHFDYTLQDLYSKCVKINNDELSSRACFLINDLFLKFLIANSGRDADDKKTWNDFLVHQGVYDWTKALKDLTVMVNDLMQYKNKVMYFTDYLIKEPLKEPYSFVYWIGRYGGGGALTRPNNSTVFSTVLNLEITAHAEGNHLLFRGTMPLASNLLDSSIHHLKTTTESSYQHSISYGTTFFAGIINDAQASPAYFIGLENLVGYAIKINICDFLEKREVSELFVIPPINSLVSLILDGEFFHTRSKTPFEPKDNNTFGIDEGSLIFFKYLTSSINDQAKFENILQAYLKKNAIIMWVPDDMKAKFIWTSEGPLPKFSQAIDFLRRLQLEQKKIARQVW